MITNRKTYSYLGSKLTLVKITLEPILGNEIHCLLYRVFNEK